MKTENKERAAMCLITTKFPAIPLPQANVLGHSRLHNIDAQRIEPRSSVFPTKLMCPKREKERGERDRERERERERERDRQTDRQTETERQMTALLIFQTSKLQPIHKENAYTTLQSN